MSLLSDFWSWIIESQNGSSFLSQLLAAFSNSVFFSAAIQQPPLLTPKTLFWNTRPTLPKLYNKENRVNEKMAAAPAAAADASADMPTFKLVLVGDGGTGELNHI